MRRIVFLLGGCDLEMVTIKRMLDKNDISYLDKRLSWGAKLSDYKEELKKLSQYETIYGIELEEDIAPPKNYKAIDHHNEHANNPSSLEQVAEILHIKLSRFQKLVAQNDSRYIPGMEAMNATKATIRRIRSLDQKAQGITKAQTWLAYKSIKNAKDNIIYSFIDTFTPLSDFFYFVYDSYIIYNEKKIVFYRYNSKEVIRLLQTYGMKKSDYYYGGGEFGFVGIKENVLEKEDIENLIKEFKKWIKR